MDRALVTAAPLILASASPRRRELLERIGLAIEIAPADADESVIAGETPADCAVRLAEAKAAIVAAARAGAWVLGADTVVALGGAILGKPADRDEAASMLSTLAGAEHQVTTGVCLIGPGGDRWRRAVTTDVVMRPLAGGELGGYVDSGEWRGKAGGYAIQGIAAALVSEVRGSVSNVVGLPVAEVLEMLAEAGGPSADFSRGNPA